MAGPLSGLKILDFTTLLPGPYASMMMADMGAEVLRILSKSRPDLNAMMPPFIPGANVSAIAAYLGRGKRCINLNLKIKHGVEIVRQLVEKYDIVFEQFRPGVMAAFGLDYESLKKINPHIIYCSLTGYGQNGPMAKRAGHDINYLSLSGLMSYSGRKDTGPVLTGMQIADVAAGSINAVLGILAAVISRNNTGEGQHVDVAMTDGSVAFNAMVGAAFLADSSHQPGREEFLLNGGSLYDFYETKDGQYMSVGGLEPKFFEAFCKTIGRPDLISGGVSPANLSNIKSQIREIFKKKTRDEWTTLFDKTDACVEPVLSLEEALNHPHAKERGLIVDVELPNGKKVRQPATPIKFSKTPCTYTTTGVAGGVHTREVLLDLGYSEEDIEEFEKTGLFS